MSGSCCGGTGKSVAAAADKRIGQTVSQVKLEKVVAASENTGCCNDKPLNKQTTGCGC